jgi:hypothetical protein
LYHEVKLLGFLLPAEKKSFFGISELNIIVLGLSCPPQEIVSFPGTPNVFSRESFFLDVKSSMDEAQSGYEATREIQSRRFALLCVCVSCLSFADPTAHQF